MYEVFEQLLLKFKVAAVDVCNATGIGQSTISNWKSRRNLISGKNAKLIADYFGVSVDFLMTGEENENEQKYYINKESEEMAQFLFENPDYKVLFDASKKVKPEDIQFVKEMIDRMSGRE